MIILKKAVKPQDLPLFNFCNHVNVVPSTFMLKVAALEDHKKAKTGT